jgi:hypothetical protein
MRRLFPLSLVLGVTFSAVTASAQVPAPQAANTVAPAVAPVEIPGIVTDRPDFTESSEVVPKGGFQFESGISYEGDGSARAVGAPSALMRIGLGGRAELRIGADGYLSEAVQGVRTSGGSDMEIGGKVRLFNQDQIGVDLALLPAVSLPTGTEAFTSGGYDPSMKITWARELPAGFGLTGNVNWGSVSDEAGRFSQEALSFSLGHSLGAGWAGYAEIYGFSRLERDGDRAITFNGGFARPVGDTIQFDIEAGRGLTSGAPDWFVGFGFAIRGPIGRR